MRVLALDSSGIVASVAVVEDDTLVAEYTVNYKKTHSQTLLPMLDEIAHMTELDLNTVDAIAVAALSRAMLSCWQNTAAFPYGTALRIFITPRRSWPTF